MPGGAGCWEQKENVFSVREATAGSFVSLAHVFLVHMSNFIL